MTDDQRTPDGEAVARNPTPAPPHKRLVRWLAENPAYAVAIPIAVAIAVTVIGTAIGRDIEVPRWVKFFAVVAALTAPYWYMVGKKMIAILWSPSFVWVVLLEAADPSVGGIARVPSEDFGEYDVTKGSLDWVAPNLAFATAVDLEEQTLEGNWRGSLSDRELLTALHAVAECRGQLLDDAKRGFLIESQSWTIVRSATRNATRKVVETFAKGTLPERGEGLDRAIEDAIESSGLDELLDDETKDDLELPDDWNLEDGQRLRAGAAPDRGDRADREDWTFGEDGDRQNGAGVTVPDGRTLKNEGD